MINSVTDVQIYSFFLLRLNFYHEKGLLGHLLDISIQANAPLSHPLWLLKHGPIFPLSRLRGE